VPPVLVRQRAANGRVAAVEGHAELPEVGGLHRAIVGGAAAAG
jgi:hypothetical protein